MKVQGLIVALCAITAVLAASLVVQVSFGDKALRAIDTPLAPTVAYKSDGAGSRGVPTYAAPAPDPPATGLLPNFTPVEMICESFIGEERWLYVRVTEESKVHPGWLAVLRAADVHNQRRVDAC